MCKTVSPIHTYEEKTIVCYSCKGIGENRMNDFSDPYQVTEFWERCFQCGGSGFEDVAVLVVCKCPHCEAIEESGEYPLNCITAEDKQSIMEHGYMERLCNPCNDRSLQEFLEEDDYTEF